MSITKYLTKISVGHRLMDDRYYPISSVVSYEECNPWSAWTWRLHWLLFAGIGTNMYAIFSDRTRLVNWVAIIVIVAVMAWTFRINKDIDRLRESSAESCRSIDTSYVLLRELELKVRRDEDG